MTPSKKKREGEGKKGILGKREHHRCPSVIGICSLSGSSPPAGPGFALPATCLSLAPIGLATDSMVCWGGVRGSTSDLEDTQGSGAVSCTRPQYRNRVGIIQTSSPGSKAMVLGTRRHFLRELESPQPLESSVALGVFSLVCLSLNREGVSAYLRVLGSSRSSANVDSILGAHYCTTEYFYSNPYSPPTATRTLALVPGRLGPLFLKIRHKATRSPA